MNRKRIQITIYPFTIRKEHLDLMLNLFEKVYWYNPRNIGKGCFVIQILFVCLLVWLRTFILYIWNLLYYPKSSWEYKQKRYGLKANGMAAHCTNSYCNPGCWLHFSGLLLIKTLPKICEEWPGSPFLFLRDKMQ